MAAQSYTGSERPSVARRRSQMYVDIPPISRPDTPNTPASTSTSRPHTPRAQMYIDVPPLSRGTFSAARRSSMNGQVHGPARDEEPSGSSTASSLKENTPLRLSRTNSSSTSLTSLSSLSSTNHSLSLPTKEKSKEKDDDASSAVNVASGSTNIKRKPGAGEEGPDMNTQAMSIAEKVKMKKPRLSRRQSIVEVVIPPTNTKAKKTSAAGKSKEDNGKDHDGKPAVKTSRQGKEGAGNTEDAHLYPIGWFYCHQCEKKRGNEVRLQCTLRDPKNRNERCRAKYCKPCLRNRYDQDFDELRAHTGEDMLKSEKAKHFNGESYYFECFKCRDMCNCKKCRRRRGLDPTGRFEPKQDKQLLAGSEPEAKIKKQAQPKHPKTGIPILAESSSALQEPPPIAKRKPRVKPAPKPKPIPRPTWTKLHILLTLPDVESRILIREFVHRFDGILQVSMSNVEELEELVGESLGGDEWEDDSHELVGWVSEPCVKAIIMGLLEVISGRASALGYTDLSKAIKEAIKTIRSSGANLNRIWGALGALRGSARQYDGGLGRVLIRYPDPLSPPASTTYRSTRSGGAAESGVNVACSAQMVPVVAFLVNQAIDSPAIREAIELGVTDVKDITQGAREAMTRENARYKEEKEGQKTKDKEEVKAARDAHVQAIQDFELGQKLALSSYAPRFSPLGRDAAGRVYYALTPSPSECQAAEKLVTGKGSGKVKLRGRRGGFGEDGRREMKRWSWFVCVHGEKPADALKAKEMKDEVDGTESELTDEEEDEWWGFWDPAEIKKLAGWLAIKHGLDAEDDREKVEKKKADPPQAGTSTNGRIAAAVPSRSSKPQQVNGTAKGNARGRPSTTTASSARSSVKGKSRDVSPLSSLSSSSSRSDSSSELSSINDSDSDVDMEDDFAQYSRPTAGKPELRALVKALTEYAEMLQWRIGRVAPEDTQAPSNTVNGAGGSDKGKEKEKAEEVPASRFYG